VSNDVRDEQLGEQLECGVDLGERVRTGSLKACGERVVDRQRTSGRLLSHSGGDRDEGASAVDRVNLRPDGAEIAQARDGRRDVALREACSSDNLADRVRRHRHRGLGNPHQLPSKHVEFGRIHIQNDTSEPIVLPATCTQAIADLSEYDRNFWEERWSQALREHGDRVAQRPANAHLTAKAGDLRPGRALDAGCGHGSEVRWLAARGWQVTAVDFAATALAYARSTAEAMAPDVAGRIDWVEADLATWTPQRDDYDLVLCLYVHVAGSVEEMVQRMATSVARGGTLFLVGHRPIDPATGAATAAAGQVQVSVEAALAALDPDRWELVVADDRPRPTAGTGVEAVIKARRRS